LYQYSKAGGGICFEGKPGDPPDFSDYSHPDAGLAWMEPYIARFPFSTTAARLRTILGSNVSAPPFPLMNTATGLNATCTFRKSYEFQPVNGAKVTSSDNPAENGTTRATPDDTNLADGYYWLFSSLTGTHPFSATKAPYQAASQTVNVGGNNATRADFSLKAARFGYRSMFEPENRRASQQSYVLNSRRNSRC